MIGTELDPSRWPHIALISCGKFVRDGVPFLVLIHTHASPKGLRHGFGVATISAGIPLNLIDWRRARHDAVPGGQQARTGRLGMVGRLGGLADAGEL
ncbi:MAG TPA: hypothetical protein VMV33_00765 [Rhodocyclaceae bacterium]|nr:hypothetical protein [Rhodocyclaceae bacterium]